MFPEVIPLNPGPWKTYQMTRRSPKSAKGLQNGIHLWESTELAAILDAILDLKNAHIWTKLAFHILFVI